MKSRVLGVILVVIVAIAFGTWFHERGSGDVTMAPVAAIPAASAPAQSEVPPSAVPGLVAQPRAAAVGPTPRLRHDAPQIRPKLEKPAVAVDEHLKAQFVDLKAEVLKTIPTQQQLATLTEEQVHMTPTVIVNASIEIGKMAQLISDHPELSGEGLLFYRECAENSKYPNSIRASCYLNFSDLAEKSDIAAAAPSVPDQIKRLAQLAK